MECGGDGGCGGGGCGGGVEVNSFFSFIVWVWDGFRGAVSGLESGRMVLVGVGVVHRPEGSEKCKMGK